MHSYSSLQFCEEFPGRQDANAEPLGPGEVANIESHDGVTVPSDCDLQHKVIAGIPENWSPQIMDLLPPSTCSEEVQDVIEPRAGEPNAGTGSLQRRLILEEEPHGDAVLECSGTQAPEETMCRAPPRPDAGDARSDSS